MTGPRDARLMAQLSAGDARAWREVYQAYAPRVWGVVANHLGPRSRDVADVVQDVFLDAARGAGGFRADAGTIEQWILGITRRKIALYWRQQARRQAVTTSEVTALADWLDGAEMAPPAILESIERGDIVRATLAQLPAEEAFLLRRKYEEGDTAEQLASATRYTVGAVRSRLKRARQRFRQTFLRMYGRQNHDEILAERS